MHIKVEEDEGNFDLQKKVMKFYLEAAETIPEYKFTVENYLFKKKKLQNFSSNLSQLKPVPRVKRKRG